MDFTEIKNLNMPGWAKSALYDLMEENPDLSTMSCAKIEMMEDDLRRDAQDMIEQANAMEEKAIVLRLYRNAMEESFEMVIREAFEDD